MIPILERLLKQRRERIEQHRQLQLERALAKLVKQVGGWEYFHLWSQSIHWKWEQKNEQFQLFADTMKATAKRPPK